MNNVHSRSLLAGYQPEVLHDSCVLVVGLGALGQNIAQNMSLIGIGHLLLVDFDDFEPHNATRSPFYPSAIDKRRLGSAKAPIVAERVYQLSTAPRPEVLYFNSMIQEVGDAAISWADVVVSAVDSVNARAWLAERSRLHGKVVIEGGFSGPRFNLATFSGNSGATCYRCHNFHRESSASCTRYALDAEASNVIPAIQSTAATLGGMMTEQVVQVLQETYRHFGRRFYGDVRELEMHCSRLQLNPRCPGEHLTGKKLGSIAVQNDAIVLSDLREPILDCFGAGEIRLSEPIHLSYACVGCGRMCAVYSIESKWLMGAFCNNCGGPWRLSTRKSPSSVTSIAVPEDLIDSSPLSVTSASAVGLRRGGAFVFASTSRGWGLIHLEGNIREYAERIVVEDHQRDGEVPYAG